MRMTDRNFIMPFAGAPLDHVEERRSAEDLNGFIKHKDCQCVLLINGRPAVREDNSLWMVSPEELKGTHVAEPAPVFLGIKEDQTPIFAFSLEDNQSLIPEECFQEMRMIAGRMPAEDLAIAGRARSLFEWFHHHPFCSACGTKNTVMNGGLYSRCHSCNRDHFPRVNPVVIMLILKGEHCLLGRSEGWPPGAFSALAGFISPGESIEEACKRETQEEVGIDVHSVNYVFSQPWPFPSQLMIGLTCETDTKELKVNRKELETAKWFSKTEVQAVFNKQSDAFLRPPRYTIAHQLLRHWLAE